MALPIRPPDRPTCKHGESLRKGCSECYREKQVSMRHCEYCNDRYDSAIIHECIPKLKAQVATADALVSQAIADGEKDCAALKAQMAECRKVMKDYVQLREDTQVTGREYLSRKKSIEIEIYGLATGGK